MTTFYEAVEGQSFDTFDDWVDSASRRLTAHPEYNDTRIGADRGYRGVHFTAWCFDQRGRRCLQGGDFMRARDENAFPVWWVWPDQIASLLMRGQL